MRNYLVVAMLMVTTAPVAQENRMDQTVFATCSTKTNQLINLDAGLKQLHDRAGTYNQHHDKLRIDLNRREAEVHRIHDTLRGKPIKRKSWKQYDDAFQLYEVALEKMQALNADGDLLGAEYQVVIDDVKILQQDINAKCGGTWEPAIINKFCDDDSGRHTAFCTVFEE